MSLSIGIRHYSDSRKTGLSATTTELAEVQHMPPTVAVDTKNTSLHTTGPRSGDAASPEFNLAIDSSSQALMSYRLNRGWLPDLLILNRFSFHATLCKQATAGRADEV
jgi:hypothetical protein